MRIDSKRYAEAEIEMQSMHVNDSHTSSLHTRASSSSTSSNAILYEMHRCIQYVLLFYALSALHK